MGGTLPAATRSVENAEDSTRRRLALLYGANTLGAVAGTTLSTFWLLELVGTRATLWLACAVNTVVALAAIRMGRGVVVREAALDAGEERLRAASRNPQSATAWPPVRFVLAAAAIVGFAFMLMELVWYRMLAPLLGGSTYTFGLILAIALTGIGLGAATYASWGRRRFSTLTGLAATCAIEAACLAFPYALGDRVALFAVFVRSMGAFGFSGYVLGWIEVAGRVVLPAAFVAGFQFPLLVALLGEGRENVGRHVGLAYAWNTLGAILGSLAGGFGLLPALSATGTWRAVVILLAILSIWALALSQRREGPPARLLLPLVAAVVSLFFVSTTGPTAAWRHSPIGAGRVRLEDTSPNALQAWLRDQRRGLSWEADGLESSVALLRTSGGYAFAINGKIDGSSRADAPTQVMSGLVGAALHP